MEACSCPFLSAFAILTRLCSHIQVSPCLGGRLSRPHRSGPSLVWKVLGACQTDLLSRCLVPKHFSQALVLARTLAYRVTSWRRKTSLQLVHHRKGNTTFLQSIKPGEDYACFLFLREGKRRRNSVDAFADRGAPQSRYPPTQAPPPPRALPLPRT